MNSNAISISVWFGDIRYGVVMSSMEVNRLDGCLYSSLSPLLLYFILSSNTDIVSRSSDKMCVLRVTGIGPICLLYVEESMFNFRNCV